MTRILSPLARGPAGRRTTARALLAAVPMALLAAALAARAPAAEAGAALPEWLCGHWVMEREGRTVEETWLDPRGGTLFGIGRTLRGDRLVEFEFLRITRRGDSLVFIAQPNGVPPTEFPLVARTARSVRFENRAHDFPQVVRYWSDRPGELRAEVSGKVGGEERAIPFEYRRRPFPAPAPRAR